MRKFVATAILFVTVICLISSSALASQVTHCRLPPPDNFEVKSFPADLPADLRQTLREKFGDIASPDAPFDTAGAIIADRPNRRAIFAWTNGHRWVIAAEILGARSATRPVWAFEVNADGSTVRFVKELRSSLMESACSAARELATHY